MHSISRAFFASAVASTLFTFAAAYVAPTTAHALPGTCSCSKVTTVAQCRATPGQCVVGNNCRIGYAPNCATIVLTSLCTVAPNKFQCTGTCDCVPIPGSCESGVAADYCDAGPPDVGPDTAPDTATDTFVPTDAPDTRDSTATDVLPDTFVPPTDGTVTDSTATDGLVDVADAPDVVVPDVPVTDVPVLETAIDTAIPPDAPIDTAVTDTPGCTFECAPGKKPVDIPGESCNKFCADPRGGGERPCVKGFTNVDGFCIPDCLVSPCPKCAICNLYDTDLDGGVFPGFCRTTDPSDPACKSGDAGPGEDTGRSDAAAGDSGPDGGEAGFVDPEGPPPDDHCCAVAPGQSRHHGRTQDGAMLAVGLAAAILVARRRR